MVEKYCLKNKNRVETNRLANNLFQQEKKNPWIVQEDVDDTK